MDRETYLKMRRSARYDMNWFYKYFTTKSKVEPVIPFEEFVRAFQMYFQIMGDSIISYLDTEFNVTTVSDKDGKFLKVM